MSWAVPSPQYPVPSTERVLSTHYLVLSTCGGKQ